MNDPLAPKPRPILTAHEPHPSPGEARRGEGPGYVVGVRFYRRMKVQRVYPMVVSVSPLARHLQGIKSHTPPLEIRPVLPGIQVTPSHYEMETTGSTPAFYLTPLARGKLAQARLEVYSHGRLVQQIPLPLKATRQRLTWILLLLTILIPPGIYYLTRRVDLSTTGNPAPAPAAVRKAQVAVEEEEEGQRPTMSDEELDKLQIEAMKKMGQKPGPGSLRRDRAGKKQETKAEAQPLEPQPVVASQRAGRVEQATINVLPDFFGVTKWIAAAVQGAYDWAHNLAQDVYLSFYVGLGLLALTILSWVVHAAARSSRRGEPMVLGT